MAALRRNRDTRPVCLHVPPWYRHVRLNSTIGRRPALFLATAQKSLPVQYRRERNKERVMVPGGQAGVRGEFHNGKQLDFETQDYLLISASVHVRGRVYV